MQWGFAFILVLAGGGAHGAEVPPALADAFESPALDARWVPLRVTDGPGEAAPSGGRLRLWLDTRGTTPDRPKVVGVRTRDPLAFAEAIEIAWALDWNAQVNGAYLQAALYLAPAPAEGDPQDAPEWVRVAHVGVPPGQNWRHEVAERRDGLLRFVDRAGWPAERAGRPPAPVRASLAVTREGDLVYRENGQVRSSGRITPLHWPQIHVFLTLTSHSNYPERSVFMDDVEVRTR